MYKCKYEATRVRLYVCMYVCVSRNHVRSSCETMRGPFQMKMTPLERWEFNLTQSHSHFGFKISNAIQWREKYKWTFRTFGLFRGLAPQVRDCFLAVECSHSGRCVEKTCGYAWWVRRCGGQKGGWTAIATLLFLAHFTHFARTQLDSRKQEET